MVCEFMASRSVEIKLFVVLRRKAVVCDSHYVLQNKKLNLSENINIFPFKINVKMQVNIPIILEHNIILEEYAFLRVFRLILFSM